MGRSGFTIGQVAEMTGLSTQTLRYYDKIGILKPAVLDPKNNYRYYAVHQIMTLNVINSLKNIGLSLSDIKTYLGQDDLSYVLNLLTEQKSKVRRQIEELEQREQQLIEQIENVCVGIGYNFHSPIEIKKLPDRLVVYTTVKEINNIDLIILKINELIEIAKKNRWIVLGKPILIHHHACAGQSTEEAGMDICMRVKSASPVSEKLKIIPEGAYASTYYKGPYEKFDEVCNFLHHWIENNDWKAAGKPLKLLIVDVSMTKNPANLLSEIQIPVTKKDY